MHNWLFYKVLDQLYVRFIFNDYKLQVISKFIAIPCQTLCGDAVYICKSCYSKVKKYKVDCHVVAFKLLGEWSSRELRSLQTRIQEISQFLGSSSSLGNQFLLLERFYSRIIEQICQSHDQQLYFRKSNLKQNVDYNFCRKLQKIFQVPKIIFKAGFEFLSSQQCTSTHQLQNILKNKNK